MKWERFDIIHGNAEESFFASDIAKNFGVGYLFTSHANIILETGIIRGMLQPLTLLKMPSTRQKGKEARSDQGDEEAMARQQRVPSNQREISGLR